MDIAGILRSELTIIGSMGYPDELFEVTPVLAANWERFSKIISGRVPFSDVPSAYDLAITPKPPTRSSSPSTTDTGDVARRNGRGASARRPHCSRRGSGA